MTELRSKSFRPVPLTLAVMLWPVMLMGCGGDSRVFVVGKVTLDGVPLPRGKILFRPTSGGIPSSGAYIRDGVYRVDSHGGLLPGQYEVRILADKVLPSYVAANGAPESDYAWDRAPKRSIIPRRYNEESTLTVTLSASERNVSCDFELTNKAPDQPSG